MLEQLMSQMQSQTEEVKKRLEETEIHAEAENGLVKVTVNGNRKILNITISSEIFDDKEAVEDLTIVAINRALEKAEKVHEKEMGSIAQGMLPGLGDLGGLLGK